MRPSVKAALHYLCQLIHHVGCVHMSYLLPSALTQHALRAAPLMDAVQPAQATKQLIDGCAVQIVHMENPHTLNPKVPDLDVNYHHTLQEQGWRGGLKPLNVVQPQGPSFEVEPLETLLRACMENLQRQT